MVLPPQPSSTLVLPPEPLSEPAPHVTTNEGSFLSGPVAPKESISGLVQAPARNPVTQQDDYSAVIVLKNGFVCTVTTYAVKGKILHFVTTQGDRITVPAIQLERLYPRVQQDKSRRFKVPAVRR
jgi:hypothetical protein